MIRVRHMSLALLVATGGQGAVTAGLIVRTPGAPTTDSAAVATAVTAALGAEQVMVADRGGKGATGRGAAGPRYIIEVTAKVIGDRALVDVRALRAANRELVARVAIRTLAGAVPDSAAAAARRIGQKVRAAERGGPRRS